MRIREPRTQSKESGRLYVIDQAHGSVISSLISSTAVTEADTFFLLGKIFIRDQRGDLVPSHAYSTPLILL